MKMLTIQVGMETEGFAIYDAMMQMKNEVSYTFVKGFNFSHLHHLSGGKSD